MKWGKYEERPVREASGPLTSFRPLHWKQYIIFASYILLLIHCGLLLLLLWTLAPRVHWAADSHHFEHRESTESNLNYSGFVYECIVVLLGSCALSKFFLSLLLGTIYKSRFSNAFFFLLFFRDQFTGEHLRRNSITICYSSASIQWIDCTLFGFLLLWSKLFCWLLR